MQEKAALLRASQELLEQEHQELHLPFDPEDPAVKELEEWECSVSRSVIVEVSWGYKIRMDRFSDETNCSNSNQKHSMVIAFFHVR